MRSGTAQTLAVLLLSLPVLAACSGDDDADQQPASTASASSSGSTTTRDDDGVLDDGSGDKQRKCKVTVQVTGAATASWKGAAESVQPASGSPAAFYLEDDDAGSLQVFAEGGGVPTSAVVTVDKTAYTTDPEDPSGVDASADGTRAVVDAEAADAAGNTVQLVAKFTCGK